MGLRPNLGVVRPPPKAVAHLGRTAHYCFTSLVHVLNQPNVLFGTFRSLEHLHIPSLGIQSYAFSRSINVTLISFCPSLCFSIIVCFSMKIASAVLAPTWLQQLVNDVGKASARFGLSSNAKKTQVMVIGRRINIMYNGPPWNK